jgi:hypothetical protein
MERKTLIYNQKITVWKKALKKCPANVTTESVGSIVPYPVPISFLT